MNAVGETARRYRRPVSALWWLKRPSYAFFMLRELSCVSVAWFVVYLLMLVHATAAGPDAYQRFLAWSSQPLVVGINLVAFAFLLLHSVTWFNLTPKALVVRVGGRPVPAAAVVGGHYLLWAATSVLIAWLVLR